MGQHFWEVSPTPFQAVAVCPEGAKLIFVEDQSEVKLSSTHTEISLHNGAKHKKLA